MNKLEEDNGSTFIPKFPSEDSIKIGSNVFTYDRTFKPDISQEEVYMHSAKGIVKDVLMGYNGTIFAYGQTSCGKTHTMEGVVDDPALMGVTPRIIQDIFNHIYNMDESLEFHIKVSYFEIYMDKIRDLLDVSKENLAVHEDQNRVPYVKGLTERFVSSPEEVLEQMEDGKDSRHIAVTNMNEHSSRSHSVFLIHVKQENTETNKKLHGKLYLVDLAGSEKVSKTGAIGDRLDEAKNINKSLSALGNVISALSESKSHTPYRDSKLTRILQESLGGNARTTIIICISPASFNETETKSTLLFGQRAKTIKNTVVVNEELSAEEWKRRFEKERDRNTKLRAHISGLEAELARWRTGTSVPKDEQYRGKPSEQVVETPSATQKPIGFEATESKLTPGDMEKFEEEKSHWYAQLDEKDEEINRLSQLISRLNSQILEQDESITHHKQRDDQLQADIMRLTKENEATKEEVNQLMHALEDIALKFEDEKIEKATYVAQNQTVNDELQKLSVLKNSQESQIETLQDIQKHQRKRIAEMLSNLLSDMGEIGTAIGGSLADMTIPNAASLASDEGCKMEQIDDEFMMAKLHMSRMKTEIKALAGKCASLEEAKTESSQKMESNESEMAQIRLKLSQNDSKIKSLQQSLKESEDKKIELEQSIDQQQDELTKLKAQGAKGGEADEALEKQLVAQREAHQKQVNQLRTDLTQKQEQNEELKEALEKREMEFERLRVEHEKIRTDFNTNQEKLQQFLCEKEMHAQAKQDLKGLEDAVSKELKTLHNLRVLFVDELQKKLKKGTSFDVAEIEAGGSLAQKQKISFLENNLEQLTRVHKQLVRDNADLRLDIPKLEKRMRSTMERVKQLEGTLKEAREAALRDRRRYQAEVDRIKEAVRQKNNQRRGHMAQIAKVIKPGQAPHTSGLNRSTSEYPSSQAPPSIRGGGGAV